MKDGEGRDIDFKNTVIIMTSNAGTDLITKLFADPETAPDAAGLAEALRPELMKHFKPAFLGRVTLVPYFPLAEDVIRQIVVLQLEPHPAAGAGRLPRRLRLRRRRWSTPSPRAAPKVSSGARNVENILSRTLLPELSAEILARLAEGGLVTGVPLGWNRPDRSDTVLERLHVAQQHTKGSQWPST